jgi:hypothetical protein
MKQIPRLNKLFNFFLGKEMASDNNYLTNPMVSLEFEILSLGKNYG